MRIISRKQDALVVGGRKSWLGGVETIPGADNSGLSSFPRVDYLRMESPGFESDREQQDSASNLEQQQQEASGAREEEKPKRRRNRKVSPSLRGRRGRRVNKGANKDLCSL